MFKIVFAVSCLFALTSAGLIASPVAYHTPIVAAHPVHVAHVAPVHVAHVAPVHIKTHVPVASSYQSTVHINHGAVPVIKAAPLLVAPTLVKSPVLVSHHHF